MAQTHSQSTYQVRLGWGQRGLTLLAEADVVIVVDALGDGSPIATKAAALPSSPTVFLASLRNASATANAAYTEQLATQKRTSINLILVGDDGAFAVEDYLAAGAVADALAKAGIDHSAPDVAVANEGFIALRRALKHLISASASGLALTASGQGHLVKAAAELNADEEAQRFILPAQAQS